MKRVNQIPCRTSQADARLSSTKRRKNGTSSDYKSSSQLLESGSHAAAITRSNSENSYVSTVAETETNGPSLESGSRHDDSEKDADTASPFYRAVTDLKSQITEKRKELLALGIKKRGLDKAEMNRLRSEVKQQRMELKQLMKRINSVTSERDKLQEDKNRLQAELTQEVDKNNQLSGDRDRLTTDKERLQNQFDQKVQALTSQIAETIAEKTNLINEKKKLGGDLAQERTDLDNLRTSLAQQKARVVELTNEVHRLLTIVGERDQQVRRKDVELSRLKADRDTFKNECDHLKEEKKTFLDEIHDLNDSVGTMREELETEKNSNARELAKRDEQQSQVDAELRRLCTEYTVHLKDCKSKQEGLDAELAKCKEATRLIDAGCALHRKNDPSAYELFDKAAVLNSDAMLPRYRKASQYFQQTDYEGCVRTCKLACDRGTNADKCVLAMQAHKTPAARVKRAGVSQTSDPRKVSPEQMSHLAEAVQLYGRSLANYSHVDVEEKHRRFKELQQRLYTIPELSQKALKRGKEFSKLGDYEKAVKAYEEAVKRNPSKPQLYVTLAWCHLKRTPKNCSDAIKHCQTAIKLDPNNASAYTKMGKAQQILGHYLKAEQSYKKALELDPAEGEAERALENLQPYQPFRY